MAPGRFKGMITGNGASGDQLGHVPLEKDVQEWSPGAGAAWALLLFSHPAPHRVISPQMAAGTTLAVSRIGMMEDCNACEPGNQSSLWSRLMHTAQLHQRLSATGMEVLLWCACARSPYLLLKFSVKNLRIYLLIDVKCCNLSSPLTNSNAEGLGFSWSA